MKKMKMPLTGKLLSNFDPEDGSSMLLGNYVIHHKAAGCMV